MDIHRSLIRSCKQGNRGAFDQLIKLVERDLFRICYGYTHNSEEALDVLQEVYLKLYRFIDQYNEQLPFLPWAKQIAVRTCLNHYRDNQKHAHLSLDAVSEEGLTLLDQVAQSSGSEWETQLAEQDLLYKCIQCLPGDYRLEITMFYAEQMSYQDISMAMNKPVGTVKSDLFRARKMLLVDLTKAGWMEA